MVELVNWRKQLRPPFFETEDEEAVAEAFEEARELWPGSDEGFDEAVATYRDRLAAGEPIPLP